MFFQRKIYLNNKPLILTNSASILREEQPKSIGYLHMQGAFRRNFRLAVQHLNRPRTLGAIIEDLSDTAIEDMLCELYKPIDAAGGVVTNEREEVLMIYRRGKWDLPKGKLDEDEAMDACAVREVCEETGLENLELGEEIDKTYHIYSQDGKDLLKRTTWYHMRGTSKDVLQPQAAENILKVEWLSKESLQEKVQQSYEAIKEILKASGHLS